MVQSRIIERQPPIAQQRKIKAALKRLQKYEWRERHGVCFLCGEQGMVRSCIYCLQPICIQCSFMLEYDFQQRACGECVIQLVEEDV